MSAPNWGKVCIATRLEKQVEADFVHAWTGLLLRGKRKGDAVLIESGKVAHVAANDLVRRFLKSPCDTLLMLDSDADVGPNFLSEFRDYEPGWEYDALQAFYTRRGWPPEPIWFKEQGGVMMQCMVLGEGTEDVAIVGTHCVLIRRAVFEGLLGDNDPATFDWFFYPRHEKASEDAAFSAEARKAGFRLGATTHVKAGHISKVVTGWETYQDYINVSGTRERTQAFIELSKMVAEFTGETPEVVMGKALQGSKNVRDAWARHQPVQANAVREFYGAQDNGYLYDLVTWNTSEFYQRITAPLTRIRDQRVLVIGAGIGGEIARLLGCERRAEMQLREVEGGWPDYDRHNTVVAFELPGVLRDFCARRWWGPVKFLKGETLFEALTGESASLGLADSAVAIARNVKTYDAVVAIDTLEHIHHDEIALVLTCIYGVLRPGGRLYVHNNFGEQAKYPMHYDHQAVWDAWLAQCGFEPEGEFVYRLAERPGAPTPVHAEKITEALLCPSN